MNRRKKLHCIDLETLDHISHHLFLAASAHSTKQILASDPIDHPGHPSSLRHQLTFVQFADMAALQKVPAIVDHGQGSFPEEHNLDLLLSITRMMGMADTKGSGYRGDVERSLGSRRNI